MDLVEKLGNRIDKQCLLEEIKAVPAYKRELLSIALGTLKPQAWRATWLLRSCISKHDEELSPKLDIIIEVIPHREEGHQRELLKLIETSSLNEEQESKLFDLCLTIWEAIAKSPSVRITAFNTMLRIAKKYPELKSELSFLTQDHYTESLSPGIRSSLAKSIRKHL